MKYEGSCHCGRIAFEVEGEVADVFDCNCSICRRKAMLMWAVPRTAFQLTTSPDAVSTYTFNTHSIQHSFCAHCGVSVFGQGERPQPMTAVNLRCVPSVDLDALQVTHVDGAKF